jgi:chorismate mutase / prephenate dehydratase
MSDQVPAQESAALAALRAQIDALDDQIGQLISQRARCAQSVAEVKKQFGQSGVFYRPEREAQVLRQAMARNPGPLSNEEFARLFREIMSACLALENPVRIAFLGPEGTFTHQAALKHFGQSAEVVTCSAIDEVFRDVEAGACQFGVVPVENSTEGVVTHTLDSFMGSNLHICGEVVLRIHHNLMVSNVTRQDSISRIYSHAQSLAQCRKWLDAHYPKAERIAVSSNAEAAKRMQSEWHAAAIAGQTAAELYGLTIIAPNIEDQPDNATRFLIIGPDRVGPSGQDKTSVLVAVRNEPGALHAILEPFHRHGVDLSRLESRPSQMGTWNYVFFIDMDGHAEDAKVKAALAEVSALASDLKWLGSYPKGVL